MDRGVSTVQPRSPRVSFTDVHGCLHFAFAGGLDRVTVALPNRFGRPKLTRFLAATWLGHRTDCRNSI